MNVPPFVPPPIEIAGNVAEEPYDVRLRFIRRVVALYGVSLLVVAGVSFAPIQIGLYDYGIVFCSLLLLSLVRALEKGRPIEQQISLVASVVLFASLGEVVHRLSVLQWPVWSLALGIVCLIAYTFCCGRDLSFTGMWSSSLLVSTVLVFVIGRAAGIPFWRLDVVAAANGAYLSFWVYDLAALQTRRRLGEEIGAVLDLYRDVLNMFSYPIRVWKHWRTHRIWSVKA